MDDWELSARARRALAILKVKDEEDLLALRRSVVVAVPLAGVKTWREIAELQTQIRHDRIRGKATSEGGEVVRALRPIGVEKIYMVGPEHGARWSSAVLQDGVVTCFNAEGKPTFRIAFAACSGVWL
jgi:hypothetical protein